MNNNEKGHSGTPAEVRNWTLETDENDVAWLGLRTSGSANVLSRQVLQELDTVLDAIYQAPPIGLVVFSHKDKGFIAGADIKEFPKLQSVAEAEQTVRTGQRILQRLEDLPIPSVAVLNGAALGGGLELALACDWRIAFSASQRTLGFPEVQLGVHPGFGGTVRALRLVGVRQAMQLMLTGKPVKPATALGMGLVDVLCEPAEWRQIAARYVSRPSTQRQAGIIDRILNRKLFRPLFAVFLRRQLRPKANQAHYPAPYAIVDLWRKHGGAPDSYAAEAASFAKLAFTPTSQNLVRVFLLQDRLKSLARRTADDISHVHVVGAGTMGADIAAWCALQGLNVTLQDREKQYVEAGLEKARKSLKRKLRDDALVSEAAARLVGDHTGEGVDNADLIIEAIFEDLEAKQTLFADLEQRARSDALLASNTSSIPLEQIASVMQQAERLVGLHFFNPVARMPLVEVVHMDTTDSQIIDKATTFVKQIKKLPLPCRATPGFLVNRILAPYMDEAFRLYEEGVQAEAIDKAAVDFGMPVGPLELADSVGLDILLHVGEIVGPTIGRQLPDAVARRVDSKHLGQKSGEGFYHWEDGKARKQAVKTEAPADAADRLILSLVNEAAACLGDKVVADTELVDAGTVFGTGFAPFRGGPLAYARSRGLETVHEDLQKLQQKYGDRFTPAEGWADINPAAGTSG